jgi:hypothetical protein
MTPSLSLCRPVYTPIRGSFAGAVLDNLLTCENVA